MKKINLVYQEGEAGSCDHHCPNNTYITCKNEIYPCGDESAEKRKQTEYIKMIHLCGEASVESFNRVYQAAETGSCNHHCPNNTYRTCTDEIYQCGDAGVEKRTMQTERIKHIYMHVVKQAWRSSIECIRQQSPAVAIRT